MLHSMYSLTITSTGSPTSWEWNFGDGSANSTEQNTTHTFTDIGVYHVTLTVAKYGNNSTITKGITVYDTTFPVIESVVLSPTSTTTGSTINVTVNATDNIGVVGVNANDIPLINQGGSIWNGSFTALEGTHSVNVSAVDAAGNIAWNNSTAYTAITPDILPPSSITNLRSTNGTTWINWTWTNPSEPDFDHTEIYLNGTFQANTSAEYFNATDLQPETNYTIGTRTVDIYGNINETWINATAKTLKTLVPDCLKQPVIESVILFPANTTAGSKIRYQCKHN